MGENVTCLFFFVCYDDDDDDKTVTGSVSRDVSGRRCVYVRTNTLVNSCMSRPTHVYVTVFRDVLDRSIRAGGARETWSLEVCER
jgi:hypothetical protein